jgi:two-component system, OmpR family, response regulator ChvI
MDFKAAKHIAIVDDEESLRETVTYALTKEGYDCTAFADGLSAWESFKTGLPELLILDILMPRMDGLELCRKVRTISERIPIIFLSSKDEEIDKLLGLQIGGDDYLCKPFSVKELIMRVKVQFRRMLHYSEPDNKSDIIVFNRLELNKDCYTARWNDSELPLTVTEFLLLYALVKNPGHVKTRENLIKEAYNDNTFVSTRTIDSHIKRLRKKLLEADDNFSSIESVYGVGYRFRKEL